MAWPRVLSRARALVRVAAPTRSPVLICFSMPADAEGSWKTPHPAVTAPVAAVPATARTAAAAAAARFLANSLVFLPLTAVFSPREGKRKHQVVELEGKVQLGVLILLARPGR